MKVLTAFLIIISALIIFESCLWELIDSSFLREVIIMGIRIPALLAIGYFLIKN